MAWPNLIPNILHRFQVMADYWSIFSLARKGVPHFNASAGGDPCHSLKWYIAKTTPCPKKN